MIGSMYGLVYAEGERIPEVKITRRVISGPVVVYYNGEIVNIFSKYNDAYDWVITNYADDADVHIFPFRTAGGTLF